MLFSLIDSLEPFFNCVSFTLVLLFFALSLVGKNCHHFLNKTQKAHQSCLARTHFPALGAGNM